MSLGAEAGNAQESGGRGTSAVLASVPSVLQQRGWNKEPQLSNTPLMSKDFSRFLGSGPGNVGSSRRFRPHPHNCFYLPFLRLQQEPGHSHSGPHRRWWRSLLQSSESTSSALTSDPPRQTFCKRKIVWLDTTLNVQKLRVLWCQQKNVPHSLGTVGWEERRNVTWWEEKMLPIHVLKGENVYKSSLLSIWLQQA